MDLMDLLQKAGGEKSLGSLASDLGLDSAKTGDLVSALAPALVRGVQKQAKASGGLNAFKEALKSGGHQRYLDDPTLMGSETTRKDGNKILGHLLGGKDESRSVAAQAAESTGIDVALIKKALPMLAGLAMGALSKKGNASSADGFGLDDVLGLAKKFF